MIPTPTLRYGERWRERKMSANRALGRSSLVRFPLFHGSARETICAERLYNRSGGIARRFVLNKMPKVHPFRAQFGC
jgi:hypothetical protein